MELRCRSPVLLAVAYIDGVVVEIQVQQVGGICMRVGRFMGHEFLPVFG